MAGTITAPVGGGRERRIGLVFLAATAAASTAVGTLLGTVGQGLPRSAALAGAVAIAGAYVVYYVLEGRVPFFPWPRQLPPTWLDRAHPFRTAIRYGAVWGLGFASPIRVGSLVVLGFLVVAIGDPAVGAGCFLLVGLLKAVPSAAMPLRRSLEERGADIARAMAWQRPVIGFADAVTLAAVLGGAIRLTGIWT
jgi:hypothetical protein